MKVELEKIRTQGIKYSGSKLKLLPHILKVSQTLSVRTVLDGFSGTTRVSQAFSQQGYQVISNDRAIWSKVFGECYLKGVIDLEVKEKIRYLNSLRGKSGWFTQHYGGKNVNGSSCASDGKKKIWQTHNTKKLDVIREEIDKISRNSVEKSILLTSLILALDKVDNTLGHYVSYLRKWSPRSFKPLCLEVPLILRKGGRHRVMNKDIFKVLPQVQADLSYFDPPYGSNNMKMPPSRVRYASYYHIWKTICLNDQPQVVGKSNRRVDCDDSIDHSVFEEFRKDSCGKYLALKSLQNLIHKCRSPYILLSYNNSGRVHNEELYQMLQSQNKKVSVFSIHYKKNVMSSMCWNYKWVPKKKEKQIEFLFLIRN